VDLVFHFRVFRGCPAFEVYVAWGRYERRRWRPAQVVTQILVGAIGSNVI